MKPTLHNFKSLMRVFAPTYDEVLEAKLDLPDGVRVTVENGQYMLVHVPSKELMHEAMTKAEFFAYLKELGYKK